MNFECIFNVIKALFDPKCHNIPAAVLFAWSEVRVRNSFLHFLFPEEELKTNFIEQFRVFYCSILKAVEAKMKMFKFIWSQLGMLGPRYNFGPSCTR